MMGRAREPRGVRRLALWLALLSLFASSLAQGAGEGTRDYCMIGCSAHRLMGLRLPLDVPNTVYWWPGAANSKVRVEGPNIWEWKDIEESQRNQWHEITTTQRDDDASSYCVAAPSLGLTHRCSFQHYLDIMADFPSLWTLDCSGPPCGCSDPDSPKCEDSLPITSDCCIHQLRGLMLPLDVGSTTVFWWSGTADSAVVVKGPGIVELVDVTEAQEGHWHRVTTVSHPRKEGSRTSTPPCTVTSSSLNLACNCTQELNISSSIMFKTFDTSLTDFTPGYWALGCHDFPEDYPNSTSVRCESTATAVTGRTLISPVLIASAGTSVTVAGFFWTLIAIMVAVA
ncbi:uncharacterized protein LOC125025783 [Penaeus chinensis]|uniref:uncharacterized protein LOC125025783 n=1 Tax=Penaeus chinensis TaxID=139456 RepID=UPI001FB57BDE|nr:uncharacterized protein LOC125025783 [Penaeus chinensis]